jgi:hypothetical protein
MAGGLVDWDELTRRVKGAQELGGFANLDQFVDALDGTGITKHRLRQIKEKRGLPAQPPKPSEMREIARVCQVGYGIFTLDLRTALEEFPDGWREEIERRVLALERATRLDVAEGEAQELEDRQPPNGDQLAEEDEPGPPMAGEG